MKKYKIQKNETKEKAEYHHYMTIFGATRDQLLHDFVTRSYIVWDTRFFC